MSEYWVSKKKYFCKYCDIYIADDAPSRQQHENGLRHKGNQERFIRSIYKAGEKKKKDDEEERREMARVEQASHAAQIAFAQDVGAGRAKLSSGPTPSTSAPARKPAPKPSNPFTNYSTAKSLGYDDPDAERLAAEAEQPPPPSSSDAGVKRSAEALEEEESREFKLRKKTMATGLGQIYDPGVIPIKLKKKEEPAEPVSLITPPSGPSTNDATDKPKWAKLQWKKLGDPEQPSETPPSEVDVKSEPAVADILPKKEEEVAGRLDEPDPTIKSEADTASLPEPAPSTIVFKKRKAPAGGSRGRRPGA
ncbi:WW domain-binding protein 4 [Mycena venus]|uniref:WW domain-binding protein 4 n=1 Tax=Mycena venus TaxID=2733690 RepID=A0A8H6YP57_9AGAR|nr:WW domain-binding protein 4 [Mycena venus]